MTKKSSGVQKLFLPEMLGRKITRTFSGNDNLPALNALSIGSAVFQIEQATKVSRVNSALLPIYYDEKLAYDFDKLTELIRELLIFTLAEDITITFKKLPAPNISESLEDSGSQSENVCLFSGGTDSYAGILLAARNFREVKGVFCAHSDQARIIHIVARLERKQLIPAGIEVQKQLVPRIGARGYAQLRGFLYILSSAAWIHKYFASRLIVTECGPTMYQPRFSPLDAVTMTTHPKVVQLAKSVMTLLLGRNVEISTPFEDLTKAEVIAISPLKSGLRFTHSCVTQRFGNHDGTCYGCVLRRLATTAAGVNDVKYAANPIARENTHCGNLLSLLRFCSDVLTKYADMEEYEVGIINYYAKKNLFTRFALDNFAAVHLLLLEGHLVQRAVRRLYDGAVSVIGTQVLEDRLNTLQTSVAAPVF